MGNGSNSELAGLIIQSAILLVGGILLWSFINGKVQADLLYNEPIVIGHDDTGVGL